MPHILELSAEVLIEVFFSLFFTDLFSCKRTCRTFSAVISNSIQLTYQIELQKAGMRDNPRCPIPLLTRLEMIKTRELAWASFDFKFITQVIVPYQSLGLYDVTAGVLILGKEHPDVEFEANGVQSIVLPSKAGEDVSHEWKNFDLGKTILDSRSAIEEHDLLVCAVLVPDEENLLTSSSICIVLRQYSDPNESHVAALKPSFSVDSVLPHRGIPEVNMDLSGENLAIVLKFAGEESASDNNLFVFNWQTGERKTHLPTSIHNSGIVFLREDILLQPNIKTNSLDIYHILQTTADFKPDRISLLFSLGLPPLNPGYRVSFLSFRGEPGVNYSNDIPKYTPSTRPYVNDAKAAIMRLSMQIDPIRYEHGDEASFVMIIHRQALLDLVTSKEEEGQTSQGPNDGKSISWDAWGPPVTRWFEEGLLSDFPVDTSGQRFIQITKPGSAMDEAAPNPHHSIHILDFNPFRVKFVAKHGFNLLTNRLLELHIVQKDFSFGPGSPEYPGEGIFTQSPMGELPYVEIVSNGWPESEYSSLLIDQERVIAIRTYDLDPDIIKSLDVFYFG